MQNISNVVIDGNLTMDPETKTLPDGTPICGFRIAVNHSKDSVSYFAIKTFGKVAENCQSYLAKGSKVTVLGTLKQERWEKDGEKKEKTVIEANRVRFDFTKRNEDQPGGNYEY